MDTLYSFSPPSRFLTVTRKAKNRLVPTSITARHTPTMNKRLSPPPRGSGLTEHTQWQADGSDRGCSRGPRTNHERAAPQMATTIWEASITQKQLRGLENKTAKSKAPNCVTNLYNRKRIDRILVKLRLALVQERSFNLLQLLRVLSLTQLNVSIDTCLREAALAVLDEPYRGLRLGDVLRE